MIDLALLLIGDWLTRNAGNVVSLDTFGDPHLAAVLLKKYLRHLPDPIFPESLYPTIYRCPPPSDELDDMASVVYIRETLLPLLPPCIYILLSQVLRMFSFNFVRFTLIQLPADLMHEISIRAESNLMDARNLSLVLCPNLVKGPHPVMDVMMCAIPGGPTILQSNAPTSPIPAPTDGQTTLGMVILACIQRYYEIFDEVLDRSEPLPQSPFTEELNEERKPPAPRPLSSNEDDESIDDAMLVMPIGPPGQGNGNGNGSSRTGQLQQQPPSAWGSYINGGPVPYRPRHRKRLPESGAPSVHSVSGAGNGNGSVGGGGLYGNPKARSMVSVERGVGTNGKKGSISIGRGTTRKSSGAGVEAIGITAEGFFSPPGSVSSVPQRIAGADGRSAGT